MTAIQGPGSFALPRASTAPITTLRFVGNSAAAARHLIAGTSLDWLQPYPLASSTDADAFVVSYDLDAWRWASGELVLLANLNALAGAYPAAIGLDRVDERTAAVVREALTMAGGA